MRRRSKKNFGVSMTTERRPKKKEKPSPEQMAYKYQCQKGSHVRIEKVKLGVPLPSCQACEREGVTSKFKYISRYTIPKNMLNKTRF